MCNNDGVKVFTCREVKRVWFAVSDCQDEVSPGDVLTVCTIFRYTIYIYSYSRLYTPHRSVEVFIYGNAYYNVWIEYYLKGNPEYSAVICKHFISDRCRNTNTSFVEDICEITTKCYPSCSKCFAPFCPTPGGTLTTLPAAANVSFYRVSSRERPRLRTSHPARLHHLSLHPRPRSSSSSSSSSSSQ